MLAETNNLRKSLPPWRLPFLLLGVASGVMLGLGWAVAEVLQHDYVSLGFRRTIFLAFRDQMTWGGTVAAVVAGLCILFRLLWDGSRPVLNRVLSRSSGGDASRELGKTHWPYLICLACGLLALATRLVIYGSVKSTTTYAVVLAAFLWCLVLAVSKKAARGSRPRPESRRKALRAAFYAASVLLIVAGSALHWRHVKQLLDFEFSAPCLVSCALVLFVLAHSRAFRFSSFPHPAGVCSPPLSVLLLCMAVVLLPAALWALSPVVLHSDTTRKKPWNVILIGIDTLRWDHTSLPGVGQSTRDLTPNVARLAARGTVFNAAISQAPWTMPAFASILTGKYPHEHGAYLYYGLLRKKEATLAEVLREAGYATAAVVSHVFVDARHGFAQGFDYFNEDNVAGRKGITSKGVTDQAIEFLRQDHNKPFFLFLHYFDPHWEYLDHEGWSFADGYSGWLRDEPLDFGNVRGKRHMLESSDTAHLADLYDEEIAYTDRQIGRVLDYVRERGLEHNTVFVVVSDHGEEFMEHGCLGHQVSLYDELIRVPLAVVLPSFDHSRQLVSNTVETRAVFPTILEALGLSWNQENPARSLLPIMQQVAQEESPNEGLHSAYSSVWLPDASVRSGMSVRISSFQTDRWKLILDHMCGREYLFDLSNDPGETTNLASREPKRGEEMLQRLKEWWQRMEQYSEDVPHEEPDQKELDRLRSLGYF